MNTDLLYLSYVTMLTGLMWVPYIWDRMVVRGLTQAVGYPENPNPQSPWAQRLIKAHANAVENLVVFSALILVAHAAGITNASTAGASVVYFWARLVHVLVYTLRVPFARTIAFAVAFAAQVFIAIQLVAHSAS